MKYKNIIQATNNISLEFIESKKKDYVIEQLIDFLIEIESCSKNLQEVKNKIHNFLKDSFYKYELEERGYKLIDKFSDKILKDYYWDDFKSYLNEPHLGDCVGLPATCCRCLSEEFFNINSVTWKNKNEGNRILNLYIEEIKNEK